MGSASPGAPPLDLAVVIPVHDEAALAREVLDEWIGVLDGLGIAYAIEVYDDGSTDGSDRVLADVARAHPRVRVHRHENRGHGPTILRGYREAEAAWIFQADGDGEIPAREALGLWTQRDGRDLVVGRRIGRTSTPLRRAVSFTARTSLALLFGSALSDVNSPFRLMRRAWLDEALARIPDGSRVPNILISAWAARSGARVLELPVPFRPRPARGSWLSSGRLLRFCAGALAEVVRFSRASAGARA